MIFLYDRVGGEGNSQREALEFQMQGACFKNLLRQKENVDCEIIRRLDCISCIFNFSQ